MKIKYELQKWQLPVKYQEKIRQNIKLIVLISTFLLVFASIAVVTALILQTNRQKNEVNKELKQDLNELHKSIENLNKQIPELDKKIEAAKVAKAKLRLEKQSLASKRLPVRIVSGDCNQYRTILAKYNWNIDQAIFVMQKESGCNPYAVSPTHDHGLFQLHNQPVYEPNQNIAIAYSKYIGGGNDWGAWYAVCSVDHKPLYAGFKCA